MFTTKTIDKPIVSLKDIADVCNMSTGGISNWLSRDDEFPIPYVRTSAGPIWKSEEIARYLRNRRNINVVAHAKFSCRKIAVLGSAGAGKSFYISRFVSNKKAYRSLFCGSGKTVCPICTKVSEDFSEVYIVHTSFLSDFRKEIESHEDNSELAVKVQLIAPVVQEILSNNPYSMENADALEQINYAIKEIHDIEELEAGACADKAKVRKCTAYIETFQRPSDFCRELLRSCGLGVIELIETAGEPEYAECSEIFKSDVYTFVLKEENLMEPSAVTRIADKIRYDVSGSKTMYLYRYENIIDTAEEYSEAIDEAQTDMAAFDRCFRISEHDMIAAGLDLFARPSEHCLVFPSMKPYKNSFAERMFLADVKVKLLEAFAVSNDDDEKFSDLMRERADDVKELVLKLMRGIKAHDFTWRKEKEYTISDFSSEEHDRVSSKDGYRLTRAIEQAYLLEAGLLYYYFNGLSAEEYPEDWQQAVIRYIYAKLSQGVRKDRGLGVGTYGGEEYPPKTMLAEESLIAGIVLSQTGAYEDCFINNAYCKALKKGGVISNTWDHVECVDTNGDMQLKLQIVKRCFIDRDITTHSLTELVLYRYIGGLRKLAQYDILRKMGFSTGKAKDECMELVEEFPF